MPRERHQTAVAGNAGPHADENEPPHTTPGRLRDGGKRQLTPNMAGPLVQVEREVECQTCASHPKYGASCVPGNDNYIHSAVSSFAQGRVGALRLKGM